MNTNQLKVIIIGGTSGMGHELAHIYVSKGARVGVSGRRAELLNDMVQQNSSIVTECFDVVGEKTIEHLNALIKKNGGVDILVYSAGCGDVSDTLSWEIDKATVDANVNAFINIMNYMYRYFETQGQGHLVTISSVAALRGNSWSPAYSASKAFQSTYFEGLAIKAKKNKSNVFTTDIRPGFVDTKQAKGNKRFWVATTKKASHQIYEAIQRKKRVAYITKRWVLIAKLMKWMPDVVYHKIG